MSVDFLFPPLDTVVKDEEEEDDFDSVRSLSSSYFHQMPATACNVPVVTQSMEEVKKEDETIKEEPIDTAEEVDLSLSDVKDNIAFLDANMSNTLSSSNRRKSCHPLPSSSDEEEAAIYISHQDELIPKERRRGRPVKARFSRDEIATDPMKRKLAGDRASELRYRAKEKTESMDLKREEEKQQKKQGKLLSEVADLNMEINWWFRHFHRTFHFIPSLSVSDDSWTQMAFENLSVDQEEQNILAATKLSEQKRGEKESIAMEEDALSDLNTTLRMEAGSIYKEIRELRSKMGFHHVKTSSDRPI